MCTKLGGVCGAAKYPRRPRIGESGRVTNFEKNEPEENKLLGTGFRFRSLYASKDDETLSRKNAGKPKVDPESNTVRITRNDWGTHALENKSKTEVRSRGVKVETRVFSS